jgi:hypothetical protein
MLMEEEKTLVQSYSRMLDSYHINHYLRSGVVRG